jgi:hypothetical protein
MTPGNCGYLPFKPLATVYASLLDEFLNHGRRSFNRSVRNRLRVRP